MICNAFKLFKGKFFFFLSLFFVFIILRGRFEKLHHLFTVNNVESQWMTWATLAASCNGIARMKRKLMWLLLTLFSSDWGGREYIGLLIEMTIFYGLGLQPTANRSSAYKTFWTIPIEKKSCFKCSNSNVIMWWLSIWLEKNNRLSFKPSRISL